MHIVKFELEKQQKEEKAKGEEQAMSGTAVMNTYGERATTIVRGEGVYVWDNNNRRYLDAVSGIAVCGLGHSHPAVADAIAEQAKTLLHCSNLYNIETQQLLGERLRDLTGMDKVFFSNSGAEANEAAIKIARKYGNDKGITAPEVITANNSFHGRTMATLSATGNTKVKTGFTPLLGGFVHADYNDIDAILAVANENTVAVMVEPIQGEGGIRVPDRDYLPKLRALCDQNGWLLIFDEIQTGNGRTGTLFAFQQYDFFPDVMTTAKGLGNGVPIGACLAHGPAASVLQAGSHGSTFGGNPLATRAALAVLDTITSEHLSEHAARIGQSMLASFHERLGNLSGVKEIRGKGLMLGIELDRPCAALVDHAKEHNLLVNVTAGSTLRLLPPLIITDEQAETVVHTVCNIIEDFLKSDANES